MNAKDIEKVLLPCAHCGKLPKVYHEDYAGDVYVGDMYMAECICGIATIWYKDQELINIWNKRANKIPHFRLLKKYIPFPITKMEFEKWYSQNK